MKKLFGLLGILLVCGTVLVYAESPTLTVQQETRDLLISILEKLGIIAEKDTTVIVEPNITVTPSEVIVNPNITVEPPIVNVCPNFNVTLSDKVCEWEKYNFAIKFDNLGNTDKYGLFTMPDRVSYNDINIQEAFGLVSFYIQASANKAACEFLVNDKIVAGVYSCDDCNSRYDIAKSGSNCTKISEGYTFPCIGGAYYGGNFYGVIEVGVSNIPEGINIIELRNRDYCNTMTLKEIDFETEIKPANC